MEGLSMTIKALMKRFWTDEAGATAIEYGLVVGIISAAIISVFGTGTALSALYDVVGAVVAALS